MFTSKARKASFPDARPLYYYITDRHRLCGIPLTGCIRKVLTQGVDLIQIREKDLDDRALFLLTRRIVALAQGTGCRVLVNGRADIALAAGAHGVHLPSTGLQVSDIRPWLPAKLLIGVSVHSVGEVRRACAQGADYILMGHVFPTESKTGFGSPVGLNLLKKACAISTVPVLGLGGIRPELIDSVLATGAAGIAAITLFQDSGSDRRNYFLFNSLH